ncbi:MAG: NUDIX domain-containing protein [Acetobacteraceae bacterium]|nr:NUDIX domain-containing protein [Acetobacteraceae bacterium]
MESYLRHIRACRNISLPGARIAFRLAGQHVGWVAPPLAAALRARAEISAEPDGFNLADPVALPQLNRELAAQKFFHWRGEAFDVRATPDGPALAQMDRGALPAFGVEAQGVHLNGFVRNADGLHLWVAKRAANKTLDPGKLDHLIAGGVPTGFSPDQTLIKEAAEEAAIPAELAARARHVGLISYTMERPEGLRRDRLHCYDLDLPEDFLPVAADGEVESFALWPVARVREAVRDGEAFKFNVPLVLIDFFLRHGLIADPVAAALRRALDSP